MLCEQNILYIIESKSKALYYIIICLLGLSVGFQSNYMKPSIEESFALS